MSASTCLLTGVAGFIGSSLGQALTQRGRRVIGLDNFDAFYDRTLKQENLNRVISTSEDLFEFVEADIRDRRTIAALIERVSPEIIFHCAARAGVRPSIGSPADYTSVNVAGLISVLEAARKSGCRCVVFTSSSSVYGNSSVMPFAENEVPDRPISPYAATKRAGELICRSYAQTYGMCIVVLRLFTVFGPAQRPDLAINTFMRMIEDGQPIPMYGGGESSRDYTYIDDIIDGILAAEKLVLHNDKSRLPTTNSKSAFRKHKALSSSPDSQGFYRVFNLGSSRPVQLRQLIDDISKVVGRAARINHLPAQPGDVTDTHADLTRAYEELGFQPKTDMQEGLARQWEWMSRSSQNSDWELVIPSQTHKQLSRPQ